MNKPIKVVKVVPTTIWIENGFTGSKFVVVQHEGCEPFDYAVFNYDCRYTSNAGISAQAEKLAIELGATKPVEYRARRGEYYEYPSGKIPASVIEQLGKNHND